jgi:hypothetical protein
MAVAMYSSVAVHRGGLRSGEEMRTTPPPFEERNRY